MVADQATGKTFELEGAAADTWHAIMEHGTIEGAIDALATVYDAPRGQLEADAREFVSELLGAGLLEAEEPHPNEVP